MRDFHQIENFWMQNKNAISILIMKILYGKKHTTNQHQN